MYAALVAWPLTAQAPLESGFEGVRFGASSAELLQRFGARATQLGRPLDFGDAYVDVVLRNYDLGGYPFIVYFQIDRVSRTLKRIQIERPRHGAVAMVHRALVAALAERYGEPSRTCAGYEARPDPQAIDERIWLAHGIVIRTVFRERSLGVLESRKPGIDDFEVWEHSLDGKPQQLFVRIAPAGSEPESCGQAP